MTGARSGKSITVDKEMVFFIRCLRVGCSGMYVLIVLLSRLQTQLYDQECSQLTDWLNVEQPIGKWPPLCRLVICAVEAVQSCVRNCTETRRLFIQHGGVTMLLNVLEVNTTTV